MKNYLLILIISTFSYSCSPDISRIVFDGIMAVGSTRSKYPTKIFRNRSSCNSDGVRYKNYNQYIAHRDSIRKKQYQEYLDYKESIK